LIRPGAREFLEKMARVFEVVIFTAAMQDYADWVLDALDTGNWISHRPIASMQLEKVQFISKT
jgi:CTD small phosphatase-like protein 2